MPWLLLGSSQDYALCPDGRCDAPFVVYSAFCMILVHNVTVTKGSHRYPRSSQAVSRFIGNASTAEPALGSDPNSPIRIMWFSASSNREACPCITRSVSCPAVRFAQATAQRAQHLSGLHTRSFHPTTISPFTGLCKRSLPGSARYRLELFSRRLNTTSAAPVSSPLCVFLQSSKAHGLAYSRCDRP